MPGIGRARSPHPTKGVGTGPFKFGSWFHARASRSRRPRITGGRLPYLDAGPQIFAALTPWRCASDGALDAIVTYREVAAAQTDSTSFSVPRTLTWDRRNPPSLPSTKGSRQALQYAMNARASSTRSFTSSVVVFREPYGADRPPRLESVPSPRSTSQSQRCCRCCVTTPPLLLTPAARHRLARSPVRLARLLNVPPLHLSDDRHRPAP